MKRIVSVILIVALMLGMTSILSGCKKVKGGTEAAKLLLANERLDENLLGSDIDVGLDKPMELAALERMASLDRLYSGGSQVASAYTWDKFAKSNSTADQFESFIGNTELSAKYAAEDIARMKNRVGIVDKWVNVNFEKQMLRVYESRDVLIVDGQHDQIDVIYRYTDENANNVYEMYFFIEYDDGGWGKGKSIYIPGERYENYIIQSGGNHDYVIMENTRGYWMCTRFSYLPAGEINSYTSASFTPLIIKDGFCYATHVSTPYGENTDELDINGYSIGDIASGCELLSLNENSGSYLFNLPLSAVESGLVSIGADELSYVDGEVKDTNMINTVTTVKGSYTLDELRTDKVSIRGGEVRYDYGDEEYSGWLNINTSFDKDEIPLHTAIEEVVAYLDTLGIKLRRGASDMAIALDHARLFAEDFGSSFIWNGYDVSTRENMAAAEADLQSDIDAAWAEYLAVKDFETVHIRQRLDSNLDFADMGIVSMGENSYSNGTVTLSGITTQVADTTLFEGGKEYTLKVALSLCDENGNPISVNTLPLSGGENINVAFNGDSVTLTASGSFTVPKNLTEGDYALVVYGASADDGIRVTEMVKVGSFSTYDESLKSEAMDIQVKTVSGTLHVKYTIKNSISISMTATKDSYTAEELERVVMREILKHGAPFPEASLEYKSGEQIPYGEELGRGEYRMMCYLNTSDGLAQSYIYIEVK